MPKNNKNLLKIKDLNRAEYYHNSDCMRSGALCLFASHINHGCHSSDDYTGFNGFKIGKNIYAVQCTEGTGCGNGGYIYR